MVSEADAAAALVAGRRRLEELRFGDMDEDGLRARLTALLEEAGQRHHEAFRESDGADPEWALWYASYLQAHLWDAAGRVPTRSELVYLLIGAERAHAASGSDAPWAVAYARFLAEGLR